MDNDQNSAEIAMSKFQADGTKYFGLFDPHIPAGLTGNVLLLSLGNPDCVVKAVRKNPGASYTVVDDVWTLDCLRVLPPSERMEFIEDLDVYNIIKGLDMKFDCIIMNPPYQKNLHLKVLAEAIKHLKDDSSVCVNLAPADWLMFPYREKPSWIDGHIVSFNRISHHIANSLFKINGGNLLISVLKQGKTGFAVSDFNGFSFNENFCDPDVIRSIFNKIEKLNSPGTMNKNLTKNQFKYGLKTLYGVNWGEINTQGGNKGFRLVSKFYETAIDGKCSGHTKFLNFNTEIERKNAWKSYLTNFAKFCIMLDESTKLCPWMGDAVNPRTGLKGYLGEWTNEDFYRYFELTDDEIKIVEDTMKKYAAK